MLVVNDAKFIEMFDFMSVFGALPKNFVMEKFSIPENVFDAYVRSKKLFEVEKGFFSVSPTLGRNTDLCYLAWVTLLLPASTRYFVSATSPIKVTFLRETPSGNQLCSLYLLDYKNVKSLPLVLKKDEDYCFFIFVDYYSVELFKELNINSTNSAALLYKAENLSIKPTLEKI